MNEKEEINHTHKLNAYRCTTYILVNIYCQSIKERTDKQRTLTYTHIHTQTDTHTDT